MTRSHRASLPTPVGCAEPPASGAGSGHPLRRSPAAVMLSLSAAALAVVAAAGGLLTGGGSGPVRFVTVRGETVELFGQGLYRYDLAPRRGPGAFLIVSGAVTVLVWGIPVVSASVAGAPTEILILRRAASGYLLALALLVLEAMLAPLITAQTVSQLTAGITFTPGEVAGPMAGFVIVAATASWFLLRLLGRFGDRTADDQR